LSRVISENLESLLVIGLALLIGGVVMWVIDHFMGETAAPLLPSGPEALPLRYAGHTRSMEEMSWLQAVWIGAVQILAAVFPGVSRSMSTIAAGQLAGLTRAAALEFSFFVSIPVMLTACSYKLYEAMGENQIPPDHLGGRDTQFGVLATGFIVSFLVAWAVIAWFMAWVRRHGFVPFAIYRIALGGAVVLWALQ
jgi:undecaprenyl-diphosphatase